MSNIIIGDHDGFQKKKKSNLAGQRTRPVPRFLRRDISSVLPWTNDMLPGYMIRTRAGGEASYGHGQVSSAKQNANTYCKIDCTGSVFQCDGSAPGTYEGRRLAPVSSIIAQTDTSA